MKLAPFIILLFGQVLCTGQSPSYIHYTVSDGLPSMKVYDVEQDDEGLLWFATDNGLARFDGNRFKVFTMQDGLPDPEVLTLYKDSDQRIWISCFQKQPCYYEDGVFVTAETDSLLRAVQVSSGASTFFEDRSGNVWIGGDANKLCCWKKDKLDCFPTLERKGSVKAIFSVNDKLFAATSNWFLDVTDPNRQIALQKFPINHSTIRGSDTATKGHFIFLNYQYETLLLNYQNGGLKLLDKIETGLPGNLNTDSEDKLWIASPGKGAFRFRISDNKLVLEDTFLKGKQVARFFEGSDGTYWFITLNEGVYALKKRTSISFSSNSNSIFKSNNFTALQMLPNGEMLVGDDKGNIYTKNGQKWSSKQIGNNDGYNEIRKFLPISKSDYFVISDDGFFTKENQSVNLYFKENNEFLSLGAIKTGLIQGSRKWLGGSSGLASWEESPESATFEYNERIGALTTDQQGNVWAGGLNGILSQKDRFCIKWGEKFTAANGRVISVETAPDNTLWMASPENGLVKISVQDGTVTNTTTINEQIKKPIQEIQSIFIGNDNTKWIATKSGVYSLNDKLKINHFTKDEGLVSNDVNKILVDADTLWAATSSGLSKIILNVEPEPDSFRTYISGVNYLFNNNSYSVDLMPKKTREKESVFPAGTSMLEIELSGLYFKNKGNLQYEYITQELTLPYKDITWKNLINSVSQKFTSEGDTVLVNVHSRNLGVNIRPGRYLTKVTAILNSGVRSLLPDQHIFTVRPHWYQTIWFSLLITAMLACIGWRLYRQQTAMRRFQRTASELQLQAIKAQINPHFIGNSINAIQQFFYPPDPIKASQYISTFTSLLRRTMHFSEIPFITFEQEIEFISDYLELIKLRFEDRYEYKISKSKNIPGGTPFPAMILQPILENATIHGLAEEGVSFLNVDFILTDAKLTCKITDNGPGIEISKTKKKGQKRISKGIKLLNKKIEVLNRMHHLDLAINYLDFSTISINKKGTEVSISFNPNKIDPQLIFENINESDYEKN